VVIDVQVEVGNFKFLADIVVLDMLECPVTLGKPFLAIVKARINLEYKEIVLESKGEYLIHHLPQGNMQRRAGTECHAVETIGRLKSPKMKEPTKREQPQKEKGININIRCNAERATEGS